MTLLEHIRAKNEQSRQEMAEARANGNDLWIGMMVEDMDHWAEMGVHTVEDYERHMNEAVFRDMYRDAYGVRPRFDTSDWTNEDFQREFDLLQPVIDDNIRYEEEQEQKAIEAFEAEVQRVLDLGARDRKTALRWITQTEEFAHEQCVEHFVYKLGFLLTDAGRALVKELMEVVTFKTEGYWA